MKLFLFLLSLGVSVYTVCDALIKKQQFYPTMVYLSKSKLTVSMFYMYIVLVILVVGNLLRKLFFGALRDIEYEHLLSRFCFAVAETSLVFSVFKDELNVFTFTFFTALMFLKAFHWLADNRLDTLERTPNAGLMMHARMTSCIIFLSLVDGAIISCCLDTLYTQGASVCVVGGFECCMMLSKIGKTTLRHVLHIMELQWGTQWEHKTMFLLLVEVALGLLRLTLYVIFAIMMSNNLSIPLSMFHPLLMTLRNFMKALSDVVLSWKAINIMNRLYPDATAAELEQVDHMCVICREEMTTHAKKLPCGHIFHIGCLYSWFQRQRTCPVCRYNVLRSTPVIRTRNGAQHRIAQLRQRRRIARPDVPQISVPVRPNRQLSSNSAAPSTPPFVNIANNAASSQLPLPQESWGQPLGGLTTPPELSQLTTGELVALENMMRQSILERLKILNNVRQLTESAGDIMLVYETVVNRHQAASTANIANEPPSAPAGTVKTADQQSP